MKMTNTPPMNIQRSKAVSFLPSPVIEDTPPSRPLLPDANIELQQIRPIPQLPKQKVQLSLFKDAPIKAITAPIIIGSYTRVSKKTPISTERTEQRPATFTAAVASSLQAAMSVAPQLRPATSVSAVTSLRPVVISIDECEKVLRSFQMFQERLVEKRQYEQAEDVANLLDVMEINLDAHKTTTKNTNETSYIKVFYRYAKVLENTTK